MDEYCVELLQRATIYGDLESWKLVQQCLSETVRGWMKLHPSSTVATSLDSEENYVTRTFARLYGAAVCKRVQFSRLSDVLKYLQASLNSVILDSLRSYSRPHEITLPPPGDTGKSAVKSDNSEIWEILRKLLPGVREQRLAYLLFHCGLSPEEIVDSRSLEFNDVQEIAQLRHSVIEELLCNGITFIAAEHQQAG